VGWGYFTVQLDVRFIGTVVQEDVVAEGWVDHRGRTLVFCRAEVRTASGTLAADATLTYAIRPPR
jgi:acyl-coenzyme A thioesterase PaaI-like protein